MRERAWVRGDPHPALCATFSRAREKGPDGEGLRSGRRFASIGLELDRTELIR